MNAWEVWWERLRSNWKLSLLMLAALWAGYDVWSEREVWHPKGVLVPEIPRQIDGVEAPFVFWRDKRYTITPKADFTMRALIVSKERYRWDRESDLVDYDFLFAWGRMSDKSMTAEMGFSQSGRFGFWGSSKEPPLPVPEITSSMANMHLIPSSRRVLAKLASLRRGQVIDLHGKLVTVTAPDGWRWTSSMSRTDIGNGACELVYVEDVAVE